MKLNKVQNNSLCVLTTRLPNSSERDRFIFGVFLVDENYEGDNFEEGYVSTKSEYKIKLSPKEAEKMLFWAYHANENQPEVARWSSGLHRYFEDEQAIQILRDLALLKKGTEDEELAEEYLLALYACNGNYYIDLGKDIKLPFKSSKKHHDVIWLVEGDESYFLVGISKDIKFLNTKRTVSLDPIYSNKFSYQSISSIEKTSLFIDIGCNIPYNFLPREKHSGIFFSKDITDFSVKNVINYINSYDFELYDIGFSKKNYMILLL